MIRILHTGDLHLGRKYTNQEPRIAEKYDRARIEALKNVIRVAEEQECDYIVIAGDLFDTKYVSAALIKQVCELLSASVCPVIVLPGNHDFYEASDDKIWSKFKECAADNITLLTENAALHRNQVVFYPCVCFDKRSEKNVLGWIKDDTERAPERLHIGIAHGAIEGLSYDKEKCYYYMTKAELEQCNVDLWLIGHTHIPYPDGEVIRNQKIFNSGTHQQTDISDSAEGTVFVIDIDENKNVSAKKIHTGVLRFCNLSLDLKHGQSLTNEINAQVSGLDGDSTSIRMQISGIALAEDYDRREDIYKEFKNRFVKFEPLDAGLQPEITEEMIDAETVEGSIENKLLKMYVNEPEILNLAYDLVKNCKEGR